MLDAVAKALQLSGNSSERRFQVSWSGGPDSTALLDMMCRLRERYGFQLFALHINFQLRNQDSFEDESFCWAEAQRRQISLAVHRAASKDWGESGRQEEARALRLKISQRHFPDWELVEAHHQDDQMETFLFRLFRGSGIDGLVGMQEISERAGRKLLRPLLSFRKLDLEAYLREHQIPYRLDRSNETLAYDRNFLRNEIIPLVQKRFPHFSTSITRLQQQAQEEKHLFDHWIDAELEPRLLRSNDRQGVILRRSDLLELPAGLRHRFFHRLFQKRAQISLSREQVLDLDEKLAGGLPFVFNAPKGIVLRCGVGRQRDDGILDIDFRALLR